LQRKNTLMVAGKMGLLPRLLAASQLLSWSQALPTEQAPLLAEKVAQGKHNAVHATEQRPLHGRFLHMTGTHAPNVGRATSIAQTS
jgi:hypothetical protein